MTNIKLSKRLKCIADMVESNATLADIGCDHALLDIYLSKNEIIKNSIACDITVGALNGAKKNIAIYGVTNVETRLGDGLEVINKNDNVNTIVMSGLGDQKIINILENNINKLEKINCVIIQSNTGVNKIRRYMTSIGYYILDEKLIKERNIIYTIIKFVKGKKKYSNKELFYGPILLEIKGDLFNELLVNYINKNNHIINRLPKSKFLKKIKLKMINKNIKRILK